MTNGKQKAKRELQKLWLFFMQNGRCILCGEPIFMDQPVHTYGAPSIEHKIPVSRGGGDWLFNRGLSHNECNKWRGNRSVLKCVRPTFEDEPLRGRRPLVPTCGIWYSHFRMPPEDRRWETTGGIHRGSICAVDSTLRRRAGAEVSGV